MLYGICRSTQTFGVNRDCVASVSSGGYTFAVATAPVSMTKVKLWN
jgi:hypothetical protein